MSNEKLKIPIIAVTYADLTQDNDSIDEATLDKNTNYYRTLYTADKLKKLSNVAHVFFINDGEDILPVLAKWLCYNENLTDVDDGAFPLEEVASFQNGEFQIKNEFDTYYGEVIPKYIIVKKVD